MANQKIAQDRDISIEMLRLILSYDGQTGLLYWKERPEKLFNSKRAFSMWNKRYHGVTALTYKDKYGYLMGSIFDKPYKAHRIAWALFYGYWPNEIDHINGNKSDNRIVNLRSITHAENMKNQKIYLTNKTGFSGIQLHKRSKRWNVRLGSEWIGSTETKEDAIRMRNNAAKTLEFSHRHGQPIESASAAGVEVE